MKRTMEIINEVARLRRKMKQMKVNPSNFMKEAYGLLLLDDVKVFSALKLTIKVD